jgi:riboflavin synthase
MNDKWKSLIDLVVNEEEDKAKELFHEIAVDESRKIYENLIDEEDLADIDEASEETKEEAVEEAT